MRWPQRDGDERVHLVDRGDEVDPGVSVSARLGEDRTCYHAASPCGPRLSRDLGTGPPICSPSTPRSESEPSGEH